MTCTIRWITHVVTATDTKPDRMDQTRTTESIQTKIMTPVTTPADSHGEAHSAVFTDSVKKYLDQGYSMSLKVIS